MVKKKIGIVLEFGFHDLKKYVYSDFGKEIRKHFDIVWLAVQKNSGEFHRLFSETGFPIEYFASNDFLTTNITESRNLSVRRYWMKRKKLGNFHNYKIIDSLNLKENLLGVGFLKAYYEIKALRIVRERYYSNIVAASIKKHSIDVLFGTGYTSSFTKSVFVTGNRLNIPCFLLVNNWKDLYVNNFVPYNFLSSIFVWDGKMKSDYLVHMPYLNADKIIISGNPVFDSLKKSKPKFDRLYYSKKYNINPQAAWLYYTMMSPLAGVNEIGVVKLIGDELLKSYNKNEYVILLRKNPQHLQEDFTDLPLPENVVLTHHYSYFDREKDMHTQSPEGEQEWIDLLHHCASNLSVPSTVTLEFLTLNKPVINIGFGPDGKPDPRVNQHFEAGFYKPILSHQLVKKVENISNLTKCIISLNEIRNNTEEKPANEKLGSDVILSHLLR